MVVAAVVLAVGAGAWRLLRGGRPAGSATALAVFPFAVRGGADVAYLGEGIVNLLSTSLDGAGDLRSVDPRALLALVHGEHLAAPEPGAAARLAGRLGAGLYVLGDVVQAGDRLRVEAALYDRSRGDAAIGHASADGAPAEVFGVVDRLAAQLLVSGGAGEASRVTRLAAVTTSSLPALKAYLEGEAAFRAGRFEAAVDAFRRAVDADTAFALGYYRLSVAAEWDLRPDLAREAAAQAVRRATRLTEHDRTLLQALQLGRSGAADEAERLYRAVLAAYPEDVEAWIQLGEVLFHYGPLEGRPQEDAREPQDRVLAFEPDNGSAIVHLVRIEVGAGHADAVDSLVRRFLASNPASDRTLEMESARAMLDGDRRERQRVMARLRQAPDAVLSPALFSLNYSDDYEGIRLFLTTMVGPARSAELRAIGHAQLAFLELALGRWRTARAQFDSATAGDPALGLEDLALASLAPFLQVQRADLEALRERLARWDAGAVPPSAVVSGYFGVHNGVHPQLRSYLLGLLDARLGDEGAAGAFAASLERSTDTVLSRILFRPLARSVRVAVLERQGRADQAVRGLGASDVSYEPAIFSPFFARPLERYRRAVLLDTLRRPDEAARWYRSFRFLSLADRVFEAPAAYRLGLMLERQGRLTEAREAYTRVALLWKTCDPELRPVLDDARARLARLGG
jgi:tetratricopeptide (TPR) repeat protein